jgi:hypothetical protein
MIVADPSSSFQGLEGHHRGRRPKRPAPVVKAAQVADIRRSMTSWLAANGTGFRR